MEVKISEIKDAFGKATTKDELKEFIHTYECDARNSVTAITRYASSLLLENIFVITPPI